MKTGVVDWAVEARAQNGESECGDKCVVVEAEGGVLIVVIDGLGHGEPAASAAGRAAEVIREDPNRSFHALFLRCHHELQSTRGVVMSMAFLDNDYTMTWTGIGDIDARLVRRNITHLSPTESILLRTGIVGSNYQLTPSIFPRGVAIVRGDVLIMVTDGIRNDFDADIDVSESPEHLAADIMTRYCKKNDDALVFVGKYTA